MDDEIIYTAFYPYSQNLQLPIMKTEEVDSL